MPSSGKRRNKPLQSCLDRRSGIRGSGPRVAVLVDTSTSWGRRLIQGIGNYARKAGPWSFFLDAHGLDERLRVPGGWQGDGVIARVSNVTMARELKALRIPVVNVSGISLPGVTFPKVTTNQDDLAELAVAHFAERGFQSFAYFSLLGLSYVAAQQRAFVRAVHSRGSKCAVYAVKPQKGAEPEWNLDLKKLGEWIGSLPKPTAILAWNAGGARHLLHACKLLKLHVPEEVAVLAGSDDDLLCTFIQPELSGIQIASEQIGFAAAEILAGMIDKNRRTPKETLISPLGVVTRQSTDTLAIRDKALIKAISFIRESAAQQIQVCDIAKHAGISRRVLERRFLQHLGRTPAAEVRRTRLELARKLLLETESPIPEVAQFSAFGSPEYFAAAFKAETGQTPLEYRKTVRSR